MGSDLLMLGKGAVRVNEFSLRTVAVIGGGISGLAAAHRLLELRPELDLHLFEAEPRLGGVLHTHSEAGFQVELGSDSFITDKPWALSLCERVGLAGELLPTNDAFRRSFVVHRGRLQPVPEGFLLMVPHQWWPMVTTPILSPWGKLRLACEYLVPTKPNDDDESVASFTRRRLGRETFDRLVQPLVGGIYTADAEKLSLHATLPRFAQMEREHGSLLRAAAHKKKAAGENKGGGARYSLFVTPARGLESLLDALAARITPARIHLNAAVQQVARINNRWQLTYPLQAAGGFPTQFDGVVIALPAPRAGQLLDRYDHAGAEALKSIPYAGAAIVSLAYQREQIGHALDGFGFVVPEVERREILACSFSSIKFNGRAPDGQVLLRVFVGGAKRYDLLRHSDESLIQLAARELVDLLNITGEPTHSWLARYGEKMPQYHLGHVQRIQQIEAHAATWPQLELAGNAYHGVGIPDCIHSGEQAAERLLKEMR